ncbi:MAG: WD40/YVTN/BNR-like repeat-containing protein [Myxococcales bacterium]
MSGTVSVVEDCPLKWTLSAQVKVDPSKADPSGVGKISISIARTEEGGETAAVCHALLGKSGESPVECLLTGHQPQSYSLSARTEDGHWASQPCEVSLSLGQAQTVSLDLEFRAVAQGVIDSGNADRLLQRGDVLIKFAGAHSTFTEKVIEAGEKAVKKLSGIFHQGIRKGDPTCFHVALYLGEGRTAEAHGGDLSTARVGTRSIDEHAGFLFRIYRCQDRSLAEGAAKVAETWGTRRMKYLVPALVPFHLSSFGPAAHGEALVFGQESGREGGPRSYGAMFCSQFVIAVYQAAAVASQLRQKPKMISTEVQVPPGLDLHASNSSPLALHARLEGANATWKYVDEVLVRPQQDANAQAAPAARPGKEVTGALQLLGNPTEKRWPSGEWVYARNPWSLRAFEGRIYLGSGNSNNPPPAANAGPVDLWALDARTGAFPAEPEYVVPDEQVDVFRSLSDGLWIPGHDSRVTGRDDGRVKGESKFDHLKRLLKTLVHIPADWALGNAHCKRAGGKWETLRSIPNGIHVYDLIESGGELFAAIATVLGGQVARSKDRGRTWEELLTKPFPNSRTRTLFVLDDDEGPRLYASTNGGRIYRFDGKDSFAEMKVRFFPGISGLKEVFAARPTVFRKQVAYLAARQIIDHDWSPLGLFAAAQPDSARALPLPGGALPRDVLVHDDTLYALASTQPSARSTRVHVFATRDLQSFSEICFFDAETFARSFEMLNGDFYFGLGCDPELLQAHTGRILKVPASALAAGG